MLEKWVDLIAAGLQSLLRHGPEFGPVHGAEGLQAASRAGNGDHRVIFFCQMYQRVQELRFYKGQIDCEHEVELSFRGGQRGVNSTQRTAIRVDVLDGCAERLE